MCFDANASRFYDDISRPVTHILADIFVTELQGHVPLYARCVTHKITLISYCQFAFISRHLC